MKVSARDEVSKMGHADTRQKINNRSSGTRECAHELKERGEDQLELVRVDYNSRADCLQTWGAKYRGLSEKPKVLCMLQ
jgi:hypothetical protein